jgi:magnesium-dependent phosphatase 1
MNSNDNINNKIAIYHDHEIIDKSKITICLDIKLFHIDDHVDHEIIKVWNSLKIKPTTIVFDLDLTLWPFWIDTHVLPPFQKHSNDDQHTIIDKKHRKMTFYTDVPKILNTLRNYCLKSDGHMAIASRTSEHEGAMQLMELLEWKDHFNSFQMYPGTKKKHIRKICEELCIEDKNGILFFDDEPYNISDTEAMGCTAYLLSKKTGLTLVDCAKALKMHENKIIK